MRLVFMCLDYFIKVTYSALPVVSLYVTSWCTEGKIIQWIAVFEVILHIDDINKATRFIFFFHISMLLVSVIIGMSE